MKSFKGSNPEVGIYQNFITVEINFFNKSGKDIRAFDGKLTFTDLLDNPIFSSSLAVNDPIAASGNLTWSGDIEYNQFLDSHRRLRAENTSNLKIQFSVEKILFADGTTKPPNAVSAPEVAAIPQPPPPTPAAPIVSANYRAMLSTWLEAHKRYPETARKHNEEGRAVLHFHVDRSGRVLDYAVVSSTGYPDLDAAIDRMMQGAILPPFPADMTASDIEVSVAIRFSLAR